MNNPMSPVQEKLLLSRATALAYVIRKGVNGSEAAANWVNLACRQAWRSGNLLLALHIRTTVDAILES
jgi:hypothetical protein